LPQAKTTLIIIFLILGISFHNKAFANETLVISINNHIFTVELAVSAAERSQGLKHRKSLAPYSGMLFVYPDSQFISFWMKQTLIPLDLLFFDKDGQLVELHHNIQPCKVTDCKIYTNTKPAQFALELAAGTATELRLQVGNNFSVIEQK